MVNHGGKKKKGKKGFFRRMIGGKSTASSRNRPCDSIEIKDEGSTTNDNGESSEEVIALDKSEPNNQGETSEEDAAQEEDILDFEENSSCPVTIVSEFLPATIVSENYTALSLEPVFSDVMNELALNDTSSIANELMQNFTSPLEPVGSNAIHDLTQNYTSPLEPAYSYIPLEPAYSNIPLEPAYANTPLEPAYSSAPLDPAAMQSRNSLSSGVSNNDDRYLSLEAGRFPSNEKVVKEIEEQVDSDGESEAVSTYSNRYRKRMYKQLLVSIDTQISASTNDLIDEYVNHVRDMNDSSREFLDYSASFSSEESDEDNKELCVYIDNYIDDAYNGAMTKCKTNDGDDGRSPSETLLLAVENDDTTLRATENYIERRDSTSKNVEKKNTFGKIDSTNTSTTTETCMTSFELD